MPVFEEIARLATPLLINFQSDLGHDKAWIENHPGVEFIHITRESGTHIFDIPVAGPVFNSPTVGDTPASPAGIGGPTEAIRLALATL